MALERYIYLVKSIDAWGSQKLDHASFADSGKKRFSLVVVLWHKSDICRVHLCLVIFHIVIRSLLRLLQIAECEHLSDILRPTPPSKLNQPGFRAFVRLWLTSFPLPTAAIQQSYGTSQLLHSSSRHVSCLSLSESRKSTQSSVETRSAKSSYSACPRSASQWARGLNHRRVGSSEDASPALHYWPQWLEDSETSTSFTLGTWFITINI